MARNALSAWWGCTGFAGASVRRSALLALMLAGRAFAQPSPVSAPPDGPALPLRNLDRISGAADTPAIGVGVQGAESAQWLLEAEGEIQRLGLQEAIDYALANNPRLRSARAAIDRARGQVDVAFSPFLPRVDLFGQSGVVSKTLAPGTPGYVGILLPGDLGTRSYAEAEVGLQWTIYDFGRTGGRFGQAIGRERVGELQLTRAGQTIEFDVASAYLDVLLARASRRVQEDSVRRSEAILKDSKARRVSGVSLKEDVLRAEVQLSESREALILAREAEFNALASLNIAMGRNAALPLDVVDVESEPPLPGSLAYLMEMAAGQRAEVRMARQTVAIAERGREAARGEFLPRIYVRASVGGTEGENVITGLQQGAGLHLESPIYAGGKHQGEMRSAVADVEAAMADARSILDSVSLQVNVAYHGVVASRERIDLARTAIVQAEENLRLVQVRYSNGNATPTEIVDGETALTRSQQRFYSAKYLYLTALARLDYSVGSHQSESIQQPADINDEQEPSPQELPVPARLPTVE